MSTENRLYNVIFVLGGPGAGKGTQCSRIVTDFGYVHLSAGDLLRKERSDPQSKYRQEIESNIKNGTIVPVAITCSLLKREMENESKNGKWDFLIDGFPRNDDNNQGWHQEMNNVTKIQAVLYFDCKEDICVDRCLERGKTSGRADDNKESLQKRLKTFTEQTMPIIKYYEERNLVRKINAENAEAEVFAEVTKVMESLKS